MKKHLLVPIVAMLLIASCKPKDDNDPQTPADTTPPVITLNGKTNDTIVLNSAYTDPGAAATDNVDGNLTSSIIITGNVNKDLVGEYRRYYNVKDAAGNVAAQMTRYVYVRNQADFLVGTYNAGGNCGATPTSFITNVSISNSVNNQIFVQLNGNFAGLAPAANVNGNSINIPFGTGGGYTYSGSGVINSNKTSFSLSYLVGQGNNNFSCSTTYTRQ